MRFDALLSHPRRACGLLALALLAALLLSTASAGAATAPFTARGSAEQVDVTGATPGQQLALLKGSKVVQTRKAGSLGAVLYRNVHAGKGYRVRAVAGGATTKSFTVLSGRPAPPSTKGYSQTIPSDGYGYLTTRDGTKLAINVHLPGGDGPYPTLIEYSGYGYARPGSGESSIAQVANLLGYAVVDVNMRGTGCSGGAFDYFERLQSLDGYDVIETVARQPWVMHHKVGMMGISYGGISQMFVGSTAPPSLAGITPLSVIDNTATTLYPGGILNSGFALSWAKDRVHDSEPASETGGQSWALQRIKDGDETCKANQALHTEAVDLLAKTAKNRFYVAKVADPLSPVTFVHKVKAPVFMACQWTDEQTGGHCATLAAQFTGTRHKWFTFTNGTHIDSLDPVTFNRWFDFLELYIAKRAPKLSAAAKASAPIVFSSAMGINGITLPADPIQSEPSYAAALKAYQKLGRVRILFDNGAGGKNPGEPYPGWEKSFSQWPIPGAKARAWYLADGGRLAAAKPAAAGSDAFTWNPGARSATNFTDGNIWSATPPYHWENNPAGTALSYITDPLTADATVIGGGSVEAWIKASVPTVDLQVTLSEVRPDGKEVFVQGGWLRSSFRKLDKAKSTPLEPVFSQRKADTAPLPKGKWAKIVVPLYYEGHGYREGSRIRVTISAPGGDQPEWSFNDTLPKGTATVTLSRAPSRPSRLVLPVISGLSVPTALPPCPGLRGEPCRDFAGSLR